MAALSAYNALPIAGSTTYAVTNQLSEIFLKSYNVGSGVTTITISDTLFKLATYKAIHVRFDNVTTAGATSSRIDGGPLRNDAIVSGGAYTATVESISSTTATGWGTSSFSPTTPASLISGILLTPSGIDFSQGISQLDIYLTRFGMTFEYHHPQNTSSRRVRSTVVYPSGTAPVTPASTDFFGVLIGLAAGTFTGGTVSVFGVQ